MKAKKLAKIEDVARVAGVSTMSVSRALRGVDGVSAETRLRIEKIADELGYVPSRLAGSLARATATLVCISVPTLFDGVFAEIVNGMRATFIHAGLETLIETSDYDPAREAAWIERMITWSPAGLLICGVDRDPAVRARLLEAKIPTVEFWDVTDEPIDLCIGLDHHAAGADLGRYLADLGYRRPAYVGIAKGRDLRSEKRAAGLKAAFAEVGARLRRVRVNGPPSFETGKIGAEKALGLTPRPDVLCFLNDHLAFGGLTGCQSLGIAVPEEIGLAGFNDLNINNVLPRRMTTIRTPRMRMGQTSARLLVAALGGVRTETRVVLPVELVTGETTRRVIQS